jgi:hypothetical protein
MTGEAVLLECIGSNDVTDILIINRKPSLKAYPKTKEIVHPNFDDLSELVPVFKAYNACFFCIGVSVMGLTEEKYFQTTYTLTVRVAEAILQAKKEFVFCYISAAGTDSSEKGKVMWARVKGKTENKLFSMPFKDIYMFRPGYIQPLKGVKSHTKSYNFFYTLFKPFYFILKQFKGLVTDSVTFGRAMIKAAALGYSKKILESSDINNLGRTK